MAKVTVSWKLGQAVTTALVPGEIKIDITGGSLTSPLSMSMLADPAVFPDVPPNDPTQPYLATVTQFDNSPTPVVIGVPISAKFSVPPVIVPGVVNVPSDIVVTVG